MRNTNTKRTIWSSLVIATTALFVTSCGFDRLGDDFDVNQEAEINYADYVEFVPASFSITTEQESQGFGLVGVQISCDQISVKTYNSETGYTGTYPITYAAGDTINLGNIGGGAIDFVKGDKVDAVMEKARCQTGAGGANETYYHPQIVKNVGGSWVEKTAAEKASITVSEGSIAENYTATMTMLGPVGPAKTIKFKYQGTCVNGCTQDNSNLQFTASGFTFGTTINAAKATYGSTASFQVGGVVAPSYVFKAQKYMSTDANGAIKFAVGFECSVNNSGTALETVNAADADDVTGGRDPQCATVSHIGLKVVWINKDDGGWSNDNVDITEAQALNAINANAGKAVAVTAADLVPGGKSPGPGPNARAGVTDLTNIEAVYTANRDGFAVTNVQTADTFYSSGLKKYICVYAESGGDKGVLCQKVVFTAAP